MSKKLGLLSGLKLKDLAPEAPGIANFTTGEVMGHSSDRLADRFGVSRADQDEFALRSHHNASKAHEAGLYEDEIVPFNVRRHLKRNAPMLPPQRYYHTPNPALAHPISLRPVPSLPFPCFPITSCPIRPFPSHLIASHRFPCFPSSSHIPSLPVRSQGSTTETGIRGEATMEKMSSLKPAFVKVSMRGLGLGWVQLGSSLGLGRSGSWLGSGLGWLQSGFRSGSVWIDFRFQPWRKRRASYRPCGAPCLVRHSTRTAQLKARHILGSVAAA